MNLEYRSVYYTTVTILGWKPLLEDDSMKDIIIQALQYCVDNKRAKIWAFVIMETHFHVVWQILEPFELSYVLKNLLKFTAQRIIHLLLQRGQHDLLSQFCVRKKDRHHQIWKRNCLSIELFHDAVLWQKINYIHNNRSRKGKSDIDYKYSSARYYATGEKDWEFLV